MIEAAKKRPEPDFQQKIDRYESSKPKDDALAPYREALTGGDAQHGMAVFTTKAELECVRCHKVKGSSGEPVGGEVGPELSGIGDRQTRLYLLESIVDPNKQIAQGFESVVLATSDGQGAYWRASGRGRQGSSPDHCRRQNRHCAAKN